MSRQPEPPASISKAIWQMAGKGCDTQARAVWDALLAEGEILYRSRGGSALFEQPISVCPERRVLVIPLPVVEPRDTEQQA